jgi:hypothetical protein
LVGPGKIDVLNYNPEGPSARRPVRHPDKYDLRGDTPSTRRPFRRSTLFSRLTSRTQKAGESLQDFATAIEQFPSCLPHSSRRPYKAGGRESIRIRVKRPRHKNSTTAGRGKDGIRQALELQALLVAARPHQNNTNTYRGNRSPPPDEKMHSNQGAGAMENKAILRVIAPTDEKQNREVGPPRDKREWRSNNNTETNKENDQLSGNGRGPMERGRRRHMH